MNAASCLRPLLAPWQWAGNESSRRAVRLRALFWFGVGVAPIAAAVHGLPPSQAAVVVGLVSTIVLCALWCTQFAALLRLDHPHLARLVPGHSATLRAGVLALWAGLTAVGAGAATLMVAWAGLPGAGPLGAQVAPTAVAGVAAALLGMAMALRWPPLWLLVVALPFTGTWSPVTGALVWLHRQAQPWPTSVLLLAAMALALVSLFGRGDHGHAEVYERRERLRRIGDAGGVGNRPGLAAYGRWGEWLGAPWQWLSDRWLARAGRLAEPSAASAMSRAEIVLHGIQHWVRQLGVLVPLQLALVALFGLFALHAEGWDAARIFGHSHVGMCIGLAAMTLGTVASLRSALWASRREQALLLLPGMPRGTALNRALAWRQARQFLLVWALTLPAFAVIAWVGAVPQVLALAAATLPAMAWLWRDASRQRAPSPWSAAVPFLICLSAGLAALLLLRQWPVALLAVVGTFVGIAAAVSFWHWQLLERWPQALPAGRWG
jgi:hypothetical protein